MYNGAFPETSLRACLRALDLSPEVKAWAQRACRACGAGDGIRGVWFQKVSELVEATHPGQAQPYRDLLATLVERRPHFAFLSTWRVLLGVLAAAKVLYPSEPPFEGVARAVAAASQAMLDQAMLRPLVLSCEGDFVQYMRVIAQGSRLFFSAGEIVYREADEVSVLDYEDHPIAVELPLVLGFWRGSLGCFGWRGDFVVERHDARRYSLTYDPVG